MEADDDDPNSSASIVPQEILHQQQQTKPFNRRKNYCPKISNNDEAIEEEVQEAESYRSQSMTSDVVDVVNIESDVNGSNEAVNVLTTADPAQSAEASLSTDSNCTSFLQPTSSAATELLLLQQQQQQQRTLWLLLQNSLLANQQPLESVVGNENHALLALSKQLVALQQQQQLSTLPATFPPLNNGESSSSQPTSKKHRNTASPPANVPSLQIFSRYLPSQELLSNSLPAVSHGEEVNGNSTASQYDDIITSSAAGPLLAANLTISHNSGTMSKSSTSPLFSKQQTNVQGSGDDESCSSSQANMIFQNAAGGAHSAGAVIAGTSAANDHDNANASSAIEDDEDESNMLFIDDEEYGEDIMSNSNSGGNTGGGERQWQGVRQSVRYLDVWKYVYRCRGKHSDDKNCADFAEQQSIPGNTTGREHFHCLFCQDKLMHRKEEMIRHVKNHKKRDETLQLGFMRYTNAENCAIKFPNQNCQFREKQTHYHCLGPYCTKIYTSTSDVQMHATLHKKELQMQREGFQRFKATGGVRCEKPGCPFKDEKVTHFHCIREGCQLDAFGFKNKADLTKHKAYHDKNDQLQKQGFIKYMKHDHCPFEKCPYSKVFNHIHCLRSGCQEVFTSAAQTTTHKRKHERGGAVGGESIEPSSATVPEQQVRRLKSVASCSTLTSAENESTTKSHLMPASANAICAVQSLLCRRLLLQKQQQENGGTTTADEKVGEISTSLSSSPPSALSVIQRSTSMTSPILQTMNLRAVRFGSSSPQLSDNVNGKQRKRKQVSAATADVKRDEQVGEEDSSDARADGGGCSMEINTSNATSNGKRKRGRPPKSVAITINKRPHMPPNANPQAIFTNFKLGKSGRLVNMKSEPAAYSDGKPVHVNTTATTSVPSFTTNPSDHLPSITQGEQIKVGDGELKEIALTDFRHSAPASSSSIISPPNSGSPTNLVFSAGPNQGESRNSTADLLPLTIACRYGERCRLFTWQRPHYHCSHSRCHFGTDNTDILVCHIQQFHADEQHDLLALPTYEFYDSQIECEYADCQSNRLARHFHCTRAGCGGFSFVRHATMQSHEERHMSNSKQSNTLAATVSPPRSAQTDSHHPPTPSLAAIAALFQQQQQIQNRPLNFSNLDEFNNSSLYNALAGVVLTPPSPVVQHQISSQSLLLDALLKLIRNPLILSDSNKLSALLNLYKIATTNTCNNNIAAPPPPSNVHDALAASLLLAVQQQQQQQQAATANNNTAAQLLALTQNQNFMWPQQQPVLQQSSLNVLFPSAQGLSSSSSESSLSSLLAKLTQSSTNSAMPTSLASFSLLNNHSHNNNYQSMLPNNMNLPSSVADGSNALASMLALANGQSHHFYTANNKIISSSAASSTASNSELKTSSLSNAPSE